MRRLAMIPLAGLATLGLSGTLHAQGCVLCYTSAANAGPGAMRALDMGVASLLFPALLLFIGVCLLIVHRARVASRSAEPRAALRFSAPPAPKAVRQARNASATA
jgi:hypothetical protein